jgi:hypothetical protein
VKRERLIGLFGWRLNFVTLKLYAPATPVTRLTLWQCCAVSLKAIPKVSYSKLYKVDVWLTPQMCDEYVLSCCLFFSSPQAANVYCLIHKHKKLEA